VTAADGLYWQSSLRKAAEVLVAGVLVLDIADDIRFRLGEPTVAALARRFGPAGKCLSCGEQLGAVPLSVRAYRDPAGIITLVAYHAGCAASAWVEIGPGTLPRRETWTAAVTTISLPVAVRRRLSRLSRRESRDQFVPILLVHPSLEMTRARQAHAGEAVNADMEGYGQLGFTDPGAPACSYRLRPVGQAWMQAGRGTLLLRAMVADHTWSAPVPHPAAALALAGCGVLVGITCDRDPGQLAAETAGLEDAVAAGDVLLGWAPLPGSQHKHRPPGPCARAWCLMPRGAAWRRR
jgi:hypothetical protein